MIHDIRVFQPRTAEMVLGDIATSFDIQYIVCEL